MSLQSNLLMLLAAATFGGLLLFGPAPAQAFENGSFESGGIDNWQSTDVTLSDVVTTAPGLDGSGDWSPTEGTYFALLTTGDTDVFTELYQSFYAAPGSEVVFDAFFDAGDYVGFDDEGVVDLINLSTGEITPLFAESVPTVGDYGDSGWVSVSHTISGAGHYELRARVRNRGDSVNDSQLGLDNVSQSNPLLAPAAPSNPSPADGASSLLPEPTLAVDVSHPQDLAMDVTFYAGDGSEIGTVSDVASGDRAELDTAGLGFADEFSMSFDWYAVAEVGTRTANSPTYSFSTWAAPEVGDISFEDSSEDLAFSTSAVVASVEGQDVLVECELTVTDSAGTSESYQATADTAYGDATEALCDFGEIRYDDNSAWDPIDLVSSGVDIEVTVTDSEDLTSSLSDSHNFPNHAPLIAEALSFADLADAYGFEAALVIADSDGGAGELADGQCLFEHRLQGEATWQAETVAISAPYDSDDDLGRCALSIFAESEPGGTAGYAPGDDIEVRVVAADRHGASVISDTETYTVPVLPPDNIAVSASPTTQQVGDTINVDLQVLDIQGNELDRPVEITLSASGAATFAASQSATVTVTTDAADGTASVDVTDLVAESVTVAVESAVFDGEELAADQPHGEANLEFEAGAAHHVAIAASDESTAGEPTTVTLQVVDEYGNPTDGQTPVCLSAEDAEGDITIEADALSDAEDVDGAICGDTNAAGTATFTLSTTKAETFTLVAESSGLPGSSSDDETTEITVVPGDADHFRFTTVDDDVLACGDATIEAQVVDEYDNPITAIAEGEIEAIFTALAPDGSPVIVAADLDDLEMTADESVVGTIPTSGRATFEVSLDAAADLELTWSSSDLAGDPANHPTGNVPFDLGPVDPSTSTITASGDEIFAYSGRIDIEVTPRDSCGLPLGADQDVELESTFGDLTPVVEEDDGVYSSVFSTAADECPDDPAQIDARVNGELLDDWVEVTSLCADIDPTSPVVLTPGDEVIEACAAGETFAAIEVRPLNPEGGPMPPDQDVTVTTDEPYLVSGGVDSVTDSETGETTYTVWVGSNRCSETPQEVEIQVGGVPLDETVSVEFTCPSISAGGVTFEADPGEVPADGQTMSTVDIAVVDSCGNPAFGRTIDLTVFGNADASLSDEQLTTNDAEGDASDGMASVDLSATTPGTAGLRADVGSITQESDSDLVTFTLPDVLELVYSTEDTEVIEGDTVTIVAELTNIYGIDLTDLVLTHDVEGLEIVDAEPVDSSSELAHNIDTLEAGETVSVTFEADITGQEEATAQLTVEYGAENSPDRNDLVSDEILFTVSPPADDALSGGGAVDGCGCGATNGGSPDWALILLTAFGFVAIRRIRRRPRPEAKA